MPYMHTVRNPEGELVRQQRTNHAGQLGWRLRVHDPRTGKQPERVFYGTYEQAVRELAKESAALAAQVAPRVAHAKAVTVGDWIPQWLAIYAWKVPPSKNGKYAGVRREYSTYKKAENIAVAQLAPALGENTRLSQIDHDMLLDAISGLTRLDRRTNEPTDEPLAESTLATVASVARAMFRDAMKAGVLPASPAAGLPTNWGTGVTRRTALIPSILEVEKLATAMDQTWPLPTWARDLYGPERRGPG